MTKTKSKQPTKTQAQTKSKPPAAQKTDKRVTKRDQLIRLLSRKGGATIAQLEDKLGWQSHTVRAAISRLRKAGHDIERENAEGKRGSIYRAVADGKKQPPNRARSKIAAFDTATA